MKTKNHEYLFAEKDKTTMANVLVENASEVFHGWQTAGLTALQLRSDPLPFVAKGVLLKVPSTNTNSVWVGNKNVTADTNATSGGMEIEPGEALFIPIDGIEKLWVISNAATQPVGWMAL